MATPEYYDADQPSRAEIDSTTGPLVLEFGAAWCGFCQAIQPDLAAILRKVPEVRHIKIEDGKGKPLGRSFRVKIWPNFVFLRDGKVMHQVARPSATELEAGFQTLMEAQE